LPGEFGGQSREGKEELLDKREGSGGGGQTSPHTKYIGRVKGANQPAKKKKKKRTANPIKKKSRAKGEKNISWKRFLDLVPKGKELRQW